MNAVANLGTATHYARFAARYQPEITGRNRADIAAGKVIQVKLGGSSIRMTPTDARRWCVGLMERAGKDPTVGLVLRYHPPGRKYPRSVKLTQAELRSGIESVYVAVRRVPRGLFDQRGLGA